MASLADTFVQSALAQNASNADKDPGGAFAQGAEIAYHNQQLQIQKQQLQQQQQQLQEAKVNKVIDWFSTGAKMDDGPAKDTFMNKYLPSGIKAMGLDQMFDPMALKMATSNPLVMKYAVNEIEQGRMDPSTIYGAAGNADKMAALLATDGFKQFGAAEDIKPAVAQLANSGAVQKAAQFNATNMAKDRRAQMLADAQTAKQQNTFAHEDTNSEQGFRTQFANKVGSDLHPLVTDKAHINSALNAGERVQAAVDKGETPNRSDTTLLATGLATTISKRINPTEFQNIMHLPGAENWTIDQWNKYVAGGTNMNVVKALMSAAKSQDTQIDQEITATKSRLESEVNTSRWASKSDSILKPLKAELDAMPKTTKSATGTVSFNGQQWSRDQLQKMVDANPNDPKAAAAKAALGGQ